MTNIEANKYLLLGDAVTRKEDGYKIRYFRYTDTLPGMGTTYPCRDIIDTINDKEGVIVAYDFKNMSITFNTQLPIGNYQLVDRNDATH